MRTRRTLAVGTITGVLTIHMQVEDSKLAASAYRGCTYRDGEMVDASIYMYMDG